VATFVSAQTTQPAPQAWGDSVQSLAQALPAESGAGAVSSIIPDEAQVRELGGSQNETRYRLQQRADGMKVISARAYVGVVETEASDLATDFKGLDNLPAALKRQYIPRDDAETKKANAVARAWINSVLNPAPGDLVAVIVLWEPSQSLTGNLLAPDAPPEVKEPLFVLIKARQSENGDVKVTQVAFGDARQALK
jgi:hypothetical protein